MRLTEKIERIRANAGLSHDEKLALVYPIKISALIDVIKHGSHPGANWHLLGSEYELNGVTYRIDAVDEQEFRMLRMRVTFTRAPKEPEQHTIQIVNPPIIPRERTDNERADLQQAVMEMLEGFV